MENKPVQFRTRTHIDGDSVACTATEMASHKTVRITLPLHARTEQPLRAVAVFDLQNTTRYLPLHDSLFILEDMRRSCTGIVGVKKLVPFRIS